jgi:hypothetical protein
MFNFYVGCYGLGTIISFLSMLLKADTEVNINTASYTISLIIDLAKIFKLDISKLNLNEVNKIFFLKAADISDWSKVYAPYFTSDSIIFKGVEQHLVTKRKPMILLSCYRSNEEFFKMNDIGNYKVYPYNKQYPLEVYATIWTKIKEAGYDVITLDAQLPLEEKCYIMNEFCDAVIGYEGGMAHLAHCLKIPCILLPYRYGFDGSILLDKENDITMDKLHLDNKTFIIRDIDMFMSWSSNNLREIITLLHHNQGNNKLLKKNKWEFISIDQWKSANQTFLPNLYEKEKKFINHYYKELQIGGI